MFPFQGKKAIVLGGTSGIGLATCKKLVRQGAHVIAYGRSTEKCKAAVASIHEAETTATAQGGGGGTSGTFAAHSLDVLDREKLEAAFHDNSGFDYLVAAATGGGRALGPFLEMDMDGFAGSFRKLWGYANAVRYGAPYMKEGGSIVLVSGSPARKCKPGYVALSCVGAAVENLVRALSKELAPRAIRINAVSPGITDTPMFDSKGDGKAAFLTQATATNPLARPGTADEVAEGIIFCLSNTYVTGTVIDVDGGAVVP
jgi:NAD(P)-dependent dehydrogenase (short-subunit alcohol dehydrogenase family)